MLISNSEVNTFLTCERQHYYAFREGIKPDKGHSKALTRGIVGHEALEAYYAAKMHGESKSDCVGFAQEVLDNNIRHYVEYAKELAQLKPIIDRYVDFYWSEPWKILEVESSHSTLLENSTVEYGLRLDLLVEVLTGRDKGQIIVVDHKFVYDFFNDREKQMNTQLVKYIRTLRKNGIPVRKGVLNQIRYRQMKATDPSMMFRRDTVVTAELESKRFMDEFQKIAESIQFYYSLPKDEHKDQTSMHIDKYTCSSCAFQPLCKLYLQGLDEKATKNMLYVHNDYVDQYRK
jgi:CRISPR/Cas system-associated exonuclease Cas4 (RecB family)